MHNHWGPHWKRCTLWVLTFGKWKVTKTRRSAFSAWTAFCCLRVVIIGFEDIEGCSDQIDRGGSYGGGGQLVLKGRARWRRGRVIRLIEMTRLSCSSWCPGSVEVWVSCSSLKEAVFVVRIVFVLFACKSVCVCGRCEGFPSVWNGVVFFQRVAKNEKEKWWM